LQIYPVKSVAYVYLADAPNELLKPMHCWCTAS